MIEQCVAPWEILLVTFTNKAAREMLGRVEELTGVDRKKFWGGTFHSLGQRILRRYGELLGIESGFTILDQGDSEALLGEAVRTIDASFTKSKDNPKPRVIAEMFSYSRNTRQPLSDVVEARYPWLSGLAEQLDKFVSEYTRRKREGQLCDYDDLLELWLRLLKEDASAEIRDVLQRRFKHVLVDEYQDTNYVQAEIVNRMAAEHRNLMVVGDNWQCIYTWRGAEFANMANFTRAFPERTIYKVETNYRSTPAILHFANDLMLPHPPIDGYPLELRAARPNRDRPYIVPQMDTRQQAWWILRRLEGLLDEGRALRDIAILYRAHYQAMDVQLEFSRAGVPYTITSGVRFFEQAHIRDFVAQLRFVTNPYDAPAFARMVMLLPKVGERTAERLHKLLEQTAEKHGISFCHAMIHGDVAKKVPAAAKEAWHDLGLTLTDVEEAMGGPSVNPAKIQAAARKASAKKAARKRSVPAKTQDQGDLFGPGPATSSGSNSGVSGDSQSPAANDEPESTGATHRAAATAEDILGTGRDQPPEGSTGSRTSPEEIVSLAIDGWYGDYLRNVYDNWQSRRDDLESLKGFAGRYETMTEMLSQLVLLNSETSDRRIDPQEETVKLSTVHQAKGLEFPVVFVIGMADNLFPLKRAIEEGDTDEERRLLYVAVTRAKDELYLIYPRVTSGGGPPQLNQPSRFLQDIPESRYEVLK
ncbi:MAG: ATP-dependent helicase [Opitutales bacterium]